MIGSHELAALRLQFRGNVLTPEDAGYDEARRVFNAAIDRRPALVARCTDAADVSAAIEFARQQHLPLSVRCSGHNVAGFAVCDDGLVVDLSAMKSITVDPANRTAQVAAGCTWGEVNDTLQPHGLGATGGFVSVTGVSGLTLGGGLGWLVRKHGLALDNLLSAEVVLADGRIVTASAEEHADLFWGLRGGGGNFGVVTRFDFRVHPVGTVLAGMVLHPIAAAGAALRRFRDFEAGAPEAFTAGALLLHYPDDPNAPPPLRNQPILAMGGVYAGPVDEGEAALRPLREFGAPLADLIQPAPHNEAQRAADFVFPAEHRWYWKSAYLSVLSDEAIDVLVSFFARVPSLRTAIVIEHIGNGALERVDEAATAFGHRGSPFNLVVTSAWTDPQEAERNVEWTRQLMSAMRPWLADAVYVNYLTGDEGADSLRLAYGAAKLSRLGELKARYDPENVFRSNQNVAPAPASKSAGA